jgi:hypothetical protein
MLINIYGTVFLYIFFTPEVMSYLRCLCIVVSNTYCFVHCIVSGDNKVFVCYLFVILRLLYPMLPVFLDCPFLIALLVFASVCLFSYIL